MNAYPKVSIVTPSLNGGKFLEEAIESVLAQNYSNFEHIIVDSYSTDNTKQIVEKYPHIKFVQKTIDPIEATNLGILQSTGEIIGFLNTDDYYLDNAFNLVTHAFLSETVDCVTGRFEVVEDGKIIHKQHFFNNRLDIENITFSPPGFCSFFFKRDVFNKIGLLDNKLVYYANDREFLLKCSLKNIVCKSLREFIFCYRQHPQSFTITKNRKNADKIREEHINLCRFFMQQNIPNKAKKYFEMWQLSEMGQHSFNFVWRRLLEVQSNLYYFGRLPSLLMGLCWMNFKKIIRAIS